MKDLLSIIYWYAIVLMPFTFTWSVFGLCWYFIGFIGLLSILTGAALFTAIMVTIGTVFGFFAYKKWGT